MRYNVLFCTRYVSNMLNGLESLAAREKADVTARYVIMSISLFLNSEIWMS